MAVRIFGYVCLGIISAVILAAAGIFAWLIADRGLPPEVPETTVLTPTVKPCGRICIRQKVNYLRDCRGECRPRPVRRPCAPGDPAASEIRAPIAGARAARHHHVLHGAGGV